MVCIHQYHSVECNIGSSSITKQKYTKSNSEQNDHDSDSDPGNKDMLKLV